MKASAMLEHDVQYVTFPHVSEKRLISYVVNRFRIMKPDRSVLLGLFRYAVILAFDVKVERESQEMADSLGVRIFSAEIIYHLFDAFTKYREDYKKAKQDEFKYGRHSAERRLLRRSVRVLSVCVLCVSAGMSPCSPPSCEFSLSSSLTPEIPS